MALVCVQNYPISISLPIKKIAWQFRMGRMVKLGTDSDTLQLHVVYVNFNLVIQNRV